MEKNLRYLKNKSTKQNKTKTKQNKNKKQNQKKKKKKKTPMFVCHTQDISDTNYILIDIFMEVLYSFDENWSYINKLKKKKKSYEHNHGWLEE